MDLVSRLRAAGCVFAEREAELLIAAEPDPARREALVERRVAGEPLEYVVGWAEFMGYRYRVAPGVFVPRHRSELLVELAVDLAPRRHRLTVIDLGCGTGALGLTVARRLRGRVPAPEVQLHLTDIDDAAVECARSNAEDQAPGAWAGSATAYRGDLDQSLPLGLRADVLLAHVPYVPTDQIELMPSEARHHEARRTLDGGADGLDPLRRLAQRVVVGGGRVADDGILLAECGRGQEDAARSILEGVGLRVDLRRDLRGDLGNPDEGWDETDPAIVMVACHSGSHEH